MTDLASLRCPRNAGRGRPSVRKDLSTASLAGAALGAATAGAGTDDFVGAAVRASDAHEPGADGGYGAVWVDEPLGGNGLSGAGARTALRAGWLRQPDSIEVFADGPLLLSGQGSLPAEKVHVEVFCPFFHDGKYLLMRVSAAVVPMIMILPPTWTAPKVSI